MSTAPVEVQVITVNYRSAKLTLRSLESLAEERRAHPELNLRVVVVENASGDEAVLEREMPRFAEFAELVISPTNAGYGAGNNVGLKRAFESGRKARYFHFLNPDTEVRPGGVAELVKFLEAHPTAGLAGGLLQNEDGSDWPYAFRFPTALSELERACELGIVSRVLGDHAVARKMGSEPEQVDWLPGASMMARRDMLERIGGFDEEYFLYYEETDLCLRAREDGWEVWYVPASRVMHIAGASTGVTAHNQGPKRVPTYWFESRRRYFVRNHGHAYAALADLAFLAGNGLAVVKRLLKHQPETPHLVRDFLRNSVLLPKNKSVKAPRPFKPAVADVRSRGGEQVKIGLVAIGRNENERLRRCLKSASAQVPNIVYVDSGSTDGSVELARTFCKEVVELDLSRPFTAARARNEGFARLKALVPDLELVQFVDGDCELNETWIATAQAHLLAHPKAAVVCGRRRERVPDASVYNRLVDIEWDTPVGLTRACGGDALMRVKAFEEAGLYAPELIAGEEPDLCFRMRERGWEIWRIDAEMTLHDAAMTRFDQWWTRHVRGGHALAESYQRHAEPRALKEVVSNVAWSMPIAWPLWPVLWLKVFRSRPDPAYATAMVLAKLPQLQGHLKFWLDKAQGRERHLIEYK